MRKAKLGLLMLVSLIICTGCWDVKEISDLALVNLIGVDCDLECKDLTAYYQIVDPKGFSSDQVSAKGAVYTYAFTGASVGKLQEHATTTLPRTLFTSHLHGYIISERFARNGIHYLLDLAELIPERRTNIPLLITDSSISNVMNSYVPIEIVTGRYLRSLIDIQASNFKNKIYPIRLKDMSKRNNYFQPTIVPIISLLAEKPVLKVSDLEDIQGNKMSLAITKGAVFIKSKMVGKVNNNTAKYFYILNNNQIIFGEKLEINNGIVDVQAKITSFNKRFTKSKKNPKLNIKVLAELRIMSNNQKKPLNIENLQEIANAFNKKVEKESNLLFELGKRNDWDVFGIQDVTQSANNYWKKTNVIVNVNSEVMTTGETLEPYK